MKKPIVTALLSLFLFYPGTARAAVEDEGQVIELSSGPSFDGPVKKALPLNDPNITGTAARLRLTRGAWDYLRITVRDTFKDWGTPGKDPTGANLILDPGYDYINHGNAGLARTTPMLWDWVRYDGRSRVRNDPGCDSASGCLGGFDYRTKYCGLECRKTSQMAPGTRWLQVRRPGTAYMGGKPSVHSDIRPHFRENGFWIADDGASFNQLQFCTSRYSKDSGSGDTAACGPQLKDITLGIDLDYNIRLFIFPNMHVEHERVPTDSWTPTVKRGPYIGLDSLQRRLITETWDCENGVQCLGDGRYCCGGMAWGACVGVWRYRYKPGDCNAHTYQRWDVWLKNLPTSAGAYSRTAAYSRQLGTYFRPGDDQSLYLNYNQMQVHSVNRSSFNGTYGCGPERFYTGQLVSGQPRYLTAGQAANCVLPKSYWSYEESDWVQCNPFDTWNSDGTYNPNNDDRKWMYPGNPNSGGYGSPGRCGAQPPCSDAWCSNIPNPKALSSAQMENRFSPGGGWYMLKLDEFQLYGGTDPRIRIKLGAPDIRLELGAAADLYLSDIPLFPNSNNENKRVLGYVGFNSLQVEATLRLFNVDDTSCTSASAAGCTGIFNPYNDGKLNPSRLSFEATVDSLKLNRTDPFLMPSAYCDSISLDLGILGSISFSFCDILNDNARILGIRIPLGVPDMLIPIIEDALKDMIAPFLEEFAAEIPNLNTALGDPMNIGTALIENGIYAVGGNYPGAYKTMPDGTVRWPIFMQPGPGGGSEVADLRMSVGFKPMAFRPPVGANNVMDVDLNDPPLSTSVYGVPTLMDPNTSGCGSNCSRGSHAATEDEDQVMDGDDYVTGASGSYLNPKTGVRQYLSRHARLPEYWAGPIAEDKRPPSWCLQAGNNGGPRTLRDNGGSASDFAALYPQTHWLSFNPTYDQAPAGSGLVTPGVKNTLGNWDTVPGSAVFRQNTNNWSLRETSPVRYDFSLHVHQRSIAQFLQAVFASGAGCLEFAAQDAEGGDTPWKSLLATERFAAFMPEIASLYPGRHMKVRLTPTATPRVRTGMGFLDFLPDSQGASAGEAPLRMRGPYALSIAIPDLKLDFVLDDPDGGDISIITMYWTPVLGLHVQSVRRCFYLDPLFNDPQCTSPYVNVRTVSGYYEFYVDMNSPNLQAAWENGLDFPAGYFNDIGTTRGDSSIVIERTICDGTSRCNRIGLSNAIPALMNSFVNLFFVSRMNFANFTIDAVHVGPDGPNDDGVGGGDYLGVYARFLGNLNVFSLLETAALLSPPGSIEPQAFVPVAERREWFNSVTPEIPIEALGSFAHVGQDSTVGYTYSVDDGFWHTPTEQESLILPTLTEGPHKLKVRAVEYTEAGPKVALEATEYSFRVDTVAPEVTLSGGEDGSPITVRASDAQTPAGYVTVEYAWNGEDWRQLSGDVVPRDGLVRGDHVLQVRARDLAGNESGARMRFSGGSDPWWERAFGLSCAQSEARDTSALLLAVVLAGLAVRRRYDSR